MSRYKEAKTGLNNVDAILEAARKKEKPNGLDRLDNDAIDHSHLMDTTYNKMAHSELYRSQVFPELFPHEKPMLIGNWSEDDREMFCGGEYVKGKND